MNVVAVGDNVVDCYYDQGVYYPGGNAVNVAVQCKRNGCTRVGYIGIFASDEKGAHIKRSLDLEGIEWQRSRTMLGVSGSPGVRLSETGDRIFVPGPSEAVQKNVSLQLVPEDIKYLDNFALCHTSCFSHMEGQLACIKEVCPISFDFSEHRDVPYIASVCKYLEYAFFSASDLSEKEILQLMQLCHDNGCKVVGCTQGAKGAVFSDGLRVYHQKAVPIDVVDTMGAGDSFIAGFLTAYHESKAMEKSLLYAAEQASRTCLYHGGFGHPHHFEKAGKLK
jgi:fructoselysine 6-kinase